MDDFYSTGYALLSIQCALLNEFSSQLRAVVLNYLNKGTLLYLRFYYDKEASEELIENWRCAITEVSADLGFPCSFDTNIERIDYPKEMPFQGRYAYLRREEGQELYAHRLNRTSLEKEKAQELLSQFYELHQKKPQHKEFVKFENSIGKTIDRDTGEHIETCWGLIQKTKEGFRILPSCTSPNQDPDRKAYPVAYAMLALQNALLGRVIPALRFVKADCNKEWNMFYLCIYYGGEVSEEILQEWEDALFETCADLGKDYLFDMKIERYDFPNKPIPITPIYDERFAYYNEEGK